MSLTTKNTLISVFQMGAMETKKRLPGEVFVNEVKEAQKQFECDWDTAWAKTVLKYPELIAAMVQPQFINSKKVNIEEAKQFVNEALEVQSKQGCSWKEAREVAKEKNPLLFESIMVVSPQARAHFSNAAK